MNIDIVVKVLIPLLGAIITYLIVPFIKQKTTKEQRENIYFWVKVAVAAAEQIYKEKGQGKLKKEYVVDFLVSKGINITIQELDVLIEAAVKELNIAQEKLIE
ncbi:phage holin, LLH family [Tepidimicrobium xylanilyticum]|uniref:Bacteriophage holin of superfamily 6 (Holin_LLH) n=1 Tax=Tepidimicrobium xylanilyticum TaxID=1123352 RepID=A0A1H3FHZ1_9FIRM|nr:phage holin, LLH family [Tepidimicrobium xylanilyticum]SDX89978.1 Bacteriophage holin of superfamily 6 (Holin_LLH) [Tepidimicrobium xylanilyticum]